MILIADSGSTKTDWAYTAGGGNAGTGVDGCTVIQTQGINPFHQDEATIRDILQKELLPNLNGDSVTKVFFYGSGLRTELQPMMKRILAEAFPQATAIEARSDLLGAARALCKREEGIACILGTGANSCLYDGCSILQNTPPLGYILGDEGSGAVLGIRFLNALYKGDLPEGLREAFFKEKGMTMADVIARVYRQPMANRFLASLSPFIHAHLDVSGLETLVIENFRLFLRRNVEPYKRRDLPVSAIGSVAFYYERQLRSAIESEGYSVGLIMKSPLEALVGYHQEQ